MDNQIEHILGLLGRADHLQALGRAVGRLHEGHPLNYPSHILLRELAAHEGIAAVRTYLDRPALRDAALARAIERLRGIDYSPLRDHGTDPEVMCTRAGAALEAALALVPDAQYGEVGDDGTVSWVNQRAFGVMAAAAPWQFEGHPVIALAERAASTLGRGYYGLTVSGRGAFYYQPAAIGVVAAVYDWLSRGELPAGLKPWEREGIDRLRRIPADRVADRTHQMRDMFLTHEVTHTYELDGEGPVRDILVRTGHDLAHVFHHGFSGPHHRGAWGRLIGGDSSPSENTFDATWVISDVLALTTQALLRPDDVITRVTTAFLWQIVEPPTVDRAPRGLITALRAMEQLDMPGLLDDLERIFAAARGAPTEAPKLMIAMEHRSWRLLYESFPHAVPDPRPLH